MNEEDRVYSCEWCDWEGSWSELEPLGSMTEESYEDTMDKSWDEDRSMCECPECGEPTPTWEYKDEE